MATLIDVATPGPSLSLTQGTTSGSPATVGQNWTANVVVMTTSPQQMNSISLPPGTYAVLGQVFSVSATSNSTAFLNLVTAVGANSWPAQSISGGAFSGPPTVVNCVIRVTVTTTVYLNALMISGTGNGYGAIYAIRIA